MEGEEPVLVLAMGARADSHGYIFDKACAEPEYRATAIQLGGGLVTVNSGTLVFFWLSTELGKFDKELIEKGREGLLQLFGASEISFG